MFTIEELREAYRLYGYVPVKNTFIKEGETVGCCPLTMAVIMKSGKDVAKEYLNERVTIHQVREFMALYFRWEWRSRRN